MHTTGPAKTWVCGPADTQTNTDLKNVMEQKQSSMSSQNEKSKNSSGDMVNRPGHYRTDENSIECIDAMVSAFGEDEVRIYSKLNAFKYIWRVGKKAGSEDTDYAKAVWYTQRASGIDPRAES